MNLIVTGGHGYIGRRFIESLPPKANVFSIVRDKTTKSRVRNEVLLDIGSPSDLGMIQNLSDLSVVHLASAYKRTHQQEDVDLLLDSLLGFGIRLLDSLPKNKTIRFINVGSALENISGVSDNPLNLYAALKISFRHILKLYPHIRPVHLKFFDVYGPSDPRGKLLTHLIHHMVSGVPLLMGSPNQEINLLHVDDVVNGLFKCVTDIDLSEGATYTLSGEVISLAQLVELVSAIGNKSISVSWNTRQGELNSPYDIWKDSPVLPQWKAETLLSEGIKELLEQYQSPGAP